MTQDALRTRPAEEWLERLTARGRALRAGADAHADAVRIRRSSPTASSSKPNTRWPAGCARPVRRRGFPTRRRRFAGAGRRWGTYGRDPPDGLRPPAADIAAWRGSTPHDRFLLLADTERLEGLHHAGGNRPSLHAETVNIGAGEQFTPAFLEISPNARMPAIVDHDTPDGPLPVFEPGPICCISRRNRAVDAVYGEGRKECLESPVLAGRQPRSDGWPTQSFRQLRQGRGGDGSRLCTPPLRRRIQSLPGRAGTPAGWSGLHPGRLFHCRHHLLALGADRQAVGPGARRIRPCGPPGGSASSRARQCSAGSIWARNCGEPGSTPKRRGRSCRPDGASLDG